MKYVLLAMLVVLLIVQTKEDMVHRKQIIALQTDNATQWQQIRQLEFEFINKKCQLPIDHARIESNVNLIGGKVFTNWELASKLYAESR